MSFDHAGVNIPECAWEGNFKKNQLSYEGIKLAKNFLDFKITVGFCTYVKILGLLKEVNLTLYQFDIICKLS